MLCWYTKCAEVGIIPKEFEIIPETEYNDIVPKKDDEVMHYEEEEIEDVIEPEEETIQDKIDPDDSVGDIDTSFLEPENKAKKKKSFHRRRKEEWKKRKSLKRIVITIEEETKEKEEDEKPRIKFKIRPPSILKMAIITLLAFTMIPLSAANPIDPNGYRPSATKTDFRDVQHNPKLIDHLQDLNYVNTTIATVHADHMGVQTFVHEVKYIIEDVENGVEQSCQSINTLADECFKDISTCQYVQIRNQKIRTNSE